MPPDHADESFMPARSPRRLRRLLTLAVVAGVLGAIAYFGDILNLAASDLRIGYGTGDRQNWTDEPFSIGHPDNYRAPGVNFNYARSHGVYIVTTRDMVVALSVESPATGKPTRYVAMSDQFVDPHNGDRYTTNGIITGVKRDMRRLLEDPAAVKAALDAGKPFPRSLERCYIKLQGDPRSPDARLIVDPRHRYLFELNQWSRAFCAWQFPK